MHLDKNFVNYLIKLFLILISCFLIIIYPIIDIG